MNTTDTVNTSIKFTDSCCSKVRELITDEGNPALKLRVFVSGVDVLVLSMASPLMKW